MKNLLLIIALFSFLAAPRRDYRDVIRDVDALLEAGSKDEAAYLKLANEIAGGVMNF